MPPATPSSSNDSQIDSAAAARDMTYMPQSPFGNNKLTNANQEGLFNLFSGYASQTPAPQ